MRPELRRAKRAQKCTWLQVGLLRLVYTDIYFDEIFNSAIIGYYLTLFYFFFVKASMTNKKRKSDDSN